MDNVFFRAEGFAVIRDKVTGEILREEKNAVHLGNLSAAIVTALSSNDSGHIRYMAFGNGGTRISEDGEILYRQPNVSSIRKSTDSLYNETFKKEITNVPGNETVPILSNSSYSDIKIIVTLETNEPNINQQAIDRADVLSQDVDGNFTYTGASDSVFDEIALYSGEPGIIGSLVNNPNATLVTHLIFHPIQKSSNRVLEIDYTVRIQLT